mmetsp:Transcript_16429/g.47181  ORF Transcript_16429/g.47181 Transcript_16429/m.47181 type:complete len:220 (+) Transcript_16429:162-821(+)
MRQLLGNRTPANGNGIQILAGASFDSTHLAIGRSTALEIFTLLVKQKPTRPTGRELLALIGLEGEMLNKLGAGLHLDIVNILSILEHDRVASTTTTAVTLLSVRVENGDTINDLSATHRNCFHSGVHAVIKLTTSLATIHRGAAKFDLGLGLGSLALALALARLLIGLLPPSLNVEIFHSTLQLLIVITGIRVIVIIIGLVPRRAIVAKVASSLPLLLR